MFFLCVKDLVALINPGCLPSVGYKMHVIMKFTNTLMFSGRPDGWSLMKFSEGCLWLRGWESQIFHIRMLAHNDFWGV